MSSKLFGINGLMNQNVDSLTEANQVLRLPRVAREGDRVSGVVDAVSKRGLHRSVIYQEGCHLHSALLIDDALFNVVTHYFDSLRVEMLVHVPANMDVEGKGLLQVVHHGARAGRSPDFKRHSALPLAR